MPLGKAVIVRGMFEVLRSFDPGALEGGRAREAQAISAGPGVYLIKRTAGGRAYSTTLTVRMDPLFEESVKN